MTSSPSPSWRRNEPAWCEHGQGHHDGSVPSYASAPEASRAWLLIEHDGPWAEQAVSTPLPGGLGKLAVAADELGIRVQLIRRPARSARDPGGAGVNEANGERGTGRVFAAWTADPEPWLADVTSTVGGIGGIGGVSGDGGANGTAGNGEFDLAAMAAGERPPSGNPVERMYLVCTHARRNRCCARFGVPLSRALAARYPEELWETTHVGGHKFAANLVLLPHGLYYGPCDPATAVAAIGAHQRGATLPHRYRG
ncbi:MAG: sucrase ferredoxin, partial [Nocardiopsaceae bacterium]|nr:sucrase ferredoxin [Nocardiopsaceae bacterium]